MLKRWDSDQILLVLGSGCVVRLCLYWDLIGQANAASLQCPWQYIAPVHPASCGGSGGLATAPLDILQLRRLDSSAIMHQRHEQQEQRPDAASLDSPTCPSK